VSQPRSPATNRLDLSRQSGFHLAFGHDAHFCACAALARVEAQEVLRRLSAVTPPLEERQLTLARCRSAAFRHVDMLLLR
jgi:cytochrome P450